MTRVDIDNDIYAKIKKFVEKNKLPSIKFYVNSKVKDAILNDINSLSPSRKSPKKVG